MKLVVGLGNPDPAHVYHRHNVGFMMVDYLSQKTGAGSFQTKFKAHYVKVIWQGHQIIFLKPMTYVNLSGHAVVACASFFKVEPPQTLVISDDLDLPQGKIRFRTQGGHGGHNGLRSIIEQWGHNDFCRMRIGIGRPKQKQSVSDFVLSNYTKDELTALEELKPQVDEHFSNFLEKH